MSVIEKIRESYTAKIIILSLITWITVYLTRKMFQDPSLNPYAYTVMISGLVSGLVFAVITVLKKRLSQVTGPLFAFLEGVFMGIYSFYLEQNYPLITVQGVAVVYASMVLMAIVFLYFYKPTMKFDRYVDLFSKIIIAIYIISMILDIFFNIKTPIIFDHTPLGILFSCFVVLIISLRYLINFKLIATCKMSIRSYPVPVRYMGWFCAFSVMTTVIWLFIESLHLIVKFS